MHEPTKRKGYSAEFKSQFVLECLSTHRGVVKKCRENNIAVSMYYYWRKQFIEAGGMAFHNARKVRSRAVSEKTSVANMSGTGSAEQLRFVQCLQSHNRSGSHLPAEVKLQVIDIVKKSTLSTSAVLKAIDIPRTSYLRWEKNFRDTGTAESLIRRPKYVRKFERKDIKDRVFKALHSPPSDFGFNRTTWQAKDLQKAIEQSGVSIGLHTIRQIIRDAGYRWLKAKKVLTSSDPDYRNKLNHIHQILENLGDKEGFFSVDEYGPFAVKHRQGKKLIPPGETFSVPQWQKSKGALIMTAALELSTNQVTHFYSEKKDTEEMIKLLDLLLSTHKHLDKIYLSWDAASWHISKKLKTRIKDNNVMADIIGSTHVEVAPLPAGAQFLNVIESIFSGLARAVIHNSNYQSKDEAKAAIDRYFSERNAYFKLNPRRAGIKIWGKERVPAVFSESHNCKDSRYR